MNRYCVMLWILPIGSVSGLQVQEVSEPNTVSVAGVAQPAETDRMVMFRKDGSKVVKGLSFGRRVIELTDGTRIVVGGFTTRSLKARVVRTTDGDLALVVPDNAVGGSTGVAVRGTISAGSAGGATAGSGGAGGGGGGGGGGAGTGRSGGQGASPIESSGSGIAATDPAFVDPIGGGSTSPGGSGGDPGSPAHGSHGAPSGGNASNGPALGGSGVVTHGPSAPKAPASTTKAMLPPVLVEWNRRGQPADVDIVYEQEIRFKPSMSPQDFQREAIREARESTAPVLVFDIEHYDYIDEHIDVVRQTTLDSKRPGRVVCWYNWAQPDKNAAFAESDAIYVPVHNFRAMASARINGLKAAQRYNKPLILQWSFRDFARGASYLSLSQAADHLETFRQMAKQVPLTISAWASDHNTAARTIGHPDFRPEPRWGVWGYTDFAQEIDAALSGGKITKGRWTKRMASVASRSSLPNLRPAHEWEQLEEAGRNEPHDGRRHQIWIFIDESEVAMIVGSSPNSVSLQQFTDTCRMFLYRGYSVAVRYPDSKAGFPSFAEFLDQL